MNIFVVVIWWNVFVFMDFYKYGEMVLLCAFKESHARVV